MPRHGSEPLLLLLFSYYCCLGFFFQPFQASLIYLIPLKGPVTSPLLEAPPFCFNQKYSINMDWRKPPLLH